MIDVEPDQGSATEQEALLQFMYLCPHGMAQFDRRGVISMLNPAFACLAMPLLPAGETFSNLIHLLNPFLPELRNLLQSHLGPGMVFDGVRVHLGPAAPNEDPRVLSLTVVRMDPDRHMAVLSDLTQQVAQERRLKEGDAWFTALVQAADDYAVVGVDRDGRVCDWNLSGERLFGRTSAEAIGQYASGLVTSGKLDPAAFRERLREAGHEGWHLDEGWRNRADGSRFWGACMVSPLDVGETLAGQPPARFIMVVRDITNRRHAAEELRLALTADHLTGVLNRRTFLERSEREVVRHAARGGGCCIAMVDADHFKAVNDSYGHAMGDNALRAIAKVLRSEARTDDLVGRLGGEEFAVTMPNTSPAVAEAMCERLRAAVAALRLEHEGQPVPLTVSVGIAVGGKSGLKQMLVDADAAMYEAKRSGRNRVCRFGRAMMAAS